MLVLTFRRRKPFLFWLVVLTISSAQAGAQEKPKTLQSDPPVSSLREEIRVRVVTLPVAVRDRWGRPITDLTAVELSVREGSRDYRIYSLERLVDVAVPNDSRPSVRLMTDLDGDSAHLAKAIPGHRLMIVVDTQNDPPMALNRALEALRRFLRERLDPEYQVALFLFDGRLTQLVPFTDDRVQLESAVARIPSIMRPRPQITSDALMRQFFHKLDMCRDFGDKEKFEHCLDASAAEFIRELILRGENFVSVLEAIVHYLEGLEGHNSVLMVGGSVSLNPTREVVEAVRAIYGRLDHIDSIERALQTDEELRPRLNRVMRRAFRNRTSISFLDRTPAPADFSAQQDRLLEPGFRPMMTAFQTGQQDFTEVAAQTGGSFVASTRVDAGLQESLRLLESTYDLSFYLPDDEPLTERRLRRLVIRSTRAGVRISPRGIAGEERGHREEMASDVHGSIEVADPVHRTIDGRPVKMTPIRITLDPASLGYEETGEYAVARFGAHVTVRSAEGHPLGDIYRYVTHSYPLALWREHDVEPPAFSVFAELDPGEYIVDAVVTVPRLGMRSLLRQDLVIAR